jgi:hypothetical protein
MLMRARSLSAILLAALALGGCTRGIEESSEVLNSPRPTPSAPGTATTVGSGTATSSPTGSETAAGERPIVLRTPLAGDEIVSPVRIQGTAESPDGVVTVTVLDAGGTMLAAMSTDVSCGTGCRGKFEAELAFFTPTRQWGTVVVSVPSDTDTAPPYSAQVAVTLVP